MSTETPGYTITVELPEATEALAAEVHFQVAEMVHSFVRGSRVIPVVGLAPTGPAISDHPAGESDPVRPWPQCIYNDPVSHARCRLAMGHEHGHHFTAGA